MKRTIIQYTTVVLAFLAGMIFMTYMTRMGNRDMTGDMAQAQLPVVHAEQICQHFSVYRTCASTTTGAKRGNLNALIL